MQPSWSRIAIVAGAAALAAAASAFAAPAGATRARAAKVVDKTYSCRSAPHPAFIFGAQVRLPPGGQVAAGPAMATVTTANDHAFQVVFKDVKNSLKVDKAVCRPSPRRVALEPAGLALDQTITRNVGGQLSGRCPTQGKRVLVHFRVSLTAGVPKQALLAVRRDSAKGHQLAFFKWSPRKVTDYLAGSCTTF